MYRIAQYDEFCYKKQIIAKIFLKYNVIMSIL